MFWDVLQFNDKFDLLGVGCGPLAKADARRRADQMREELREFEDACSDDDPVKAVDALVDLVYFAFGSAAAMGVQDEAWKRCWEAVHAANMAKVREGNLRDLKQGIVKPEGWKSPNEVIAAALRNQGFRI